MVLNPNNISKMNLINCLRIKKIIFLGLIACQTSLFAQRYNQKILLQNKEITAILEYQDLASIDKLDWIRIIIQNNTAFNMKIGSASYAISGYNADKSVHYGLYGIHNEHNLIHFYNDLDNSNQSLVIPPHQADTAWRFLNSSIFISEQSVPKRDNKLLIDFKVDYWIGEKRTEIDGKMIPFSFAWQAPNTISTDKLVGKLRFLLNDVHKRPIHSNLIHYLLKQDAVKQTITNDELVEAILKRDRNSVGETVLFLKILEERKAFPNAKLSERYKQGFRDAVYCRNVSELLYYWENDFLDDLLQCPYAGSMIEVLEKNALAWSIKTENKAKVYTYLKKIYQFDTHLQPSQEAFNEWSYKVKGVAISRDTTFIRYLISFLNNETEYSVVDRSMEGAYGLPPKPPKNPRPIPIVKIRVCDVAFVSLLRAIGQTNDGYEWSFKPDFLPEYSGTTYGYRTLPEATVKLTPEIRLKLKNYLNY
jgi:hypothetical protein